MRKTFIALSAVLLTGWCISNSYGEAQPDRPPGVPVEAWIAINQTTGFVVFGPDQSISRPPAHSPPALRGYFVAKYKGTWMRLEALPGDGSFRFR